MGSDILDYFELSGSVYSGLNGNGQSINTALLKFQGNNFTFQTIQPAIFELINLNIFTNINALD